MIAPTASPDRRRSAVECSSSRKQLKGHAAAERNLPIGRRQPRRDRVRVGHDGYPQPLGAGRRRVAAVPLLARRPPQGKDRLVGEEQELARGTEELFARRRRPDRLEAPHQHAAHGAFECLDPLAHGGGGEAEFRRSGVEGLVVNDGGQGPELVEFHKDILMELQKN